MTIAALFADYRPGSWTEARDLERVRGMGGDAWDRSTPLHLTASALVVHPPTSRVLLRWHARQRDWLHIGGHADPGETEPLEVALREGAEETGLTDLEPWPSAQLIHVAVVPVPAGRREPAHEHADLRFVLATVRPDEARPERADAPLRWLTLPEAVEATGAANLRESLRRVEPLLGRA